MTCRRAQNPVKPSVGERSAGSPNESNSAGAHSDSRTQGRSARMTNLPVMRKSVDRGRLRAGLPPGAERAKHTALLENACGFQLVGAVESAGNPVSRVSGFESAVGADSNIREGR